MSGVLPERVMHTSRLRLRQPRAALGWSVAAAGVAYPFGIHLALPHVPPRLLLLPALALIALRLLGGGGLVGPGAAGALLLSAGVLVVLAVLSPDLSVLAYPALMSLSAAIAFGLSLIRGPSLVERLARRWQPDLPPAAVRYVWWVSLVWCVFLAVNTIIALGIAIWGSMAQWTLWNGLLFYLAAGALMAGEWVVRRCVVR